LPIRDVAAATIAESHSPKILSLDLRAEKERFGNAELTEYSTELLQCTSLRLDTTRRAAQV
jgi:hypothetical protein